MSGPPTGRTRARRRALAAAAVVVLAVPAIGRAAIVYQRDRRPQAMYIARDDGTGARPLPVKGFGPVISPDGTKVAYHPIAAGEFDTVRILTAASGAVVASRQECVNIVWSPDSSRLACRVTTQTPGTPESSGLSLIDATTGAARPLVVVPGEVRVGRPTWSPDGTRVAYAAQRGGPQSSALFVADVSGMHTVRRLLRNAQDPVWGPATISLTRRTTRRVRVWGRRVDVPRYQIWTVNPDGGWAHRLTRYQARRPLIWGPSAYLWTAGGRRLVGMISGQDYYRPIVVSARTGRIRPLTAGTDRETRVNAVPADGRFVLVTEWGSGPTERLRTIRISGTPGRILVREGRDVSTSADWQP